MHALSIFTCISLAVSLRPTAGLILAAAFCVQELGRTDAAWNAGAFCAIACGVLLRVYLCATGRLAIRAFLAGRPSPRDWSERLRERPLAEGWRAGVLHGWRDHACLGAGSAGVGNPTVFAAALTVGCLVWSGVATAWIVTGTRLVLGLVEGIPHVWLAAAALVASAIALAWSGARLPGAFSLRGWRFARIKLETLLHAEYWPTWAWYMMIAPGLVWLVVRHRSALAWLACNPGIAAGGGFVGESKSEILKHLVAAGGEGMVLPFAVVPAGAIESRVEGLREAMTRLRLAYPVVLKPDVGERGHAVRVAHDHEQARAALLAVPTAIIVQEYEPSPVEVGVLWVRLPEDRGLCPFPGRIYAGCEGFIYSVTGKVFPQLRAERASTLEDAIERHPRFRRQHRVFLDRFADRAGSMLRPGEVVSLGKAGNHCQGTMFVDGENLITEALTLAVDRVARRFPGGLDYARFDLRAPTAEDVRSGVNLRVFEVNGTSAESTNIYDPGGTLAWARRTLLGQWRLLFALGSQRVRDGAPTPTPATLRSILREAERARSARGGQPIAD